MKFGMNQFLYETIDDNVYIEIKEAFILHFQIDHMYENFKRYSLLFNVGQYFANNKRQKKYCSFHYFCHRHILEKISKNAGL